MARAEIVLGLDDAFRIQFHLRGLRVPARHQPHRPTGRDLTTYLAKIPTECGHSVNTAVDYLWIVCDALDVDDTVNRIVRRRLRVL